MKTKISLLTALLIFTALFSFVSCGSSENNEPVDEDKLGLIDADVKSDETNLKNKAIYDAANPGTSTRINRSFENAPPLIPHNTEGFFPITLKSNICLSCHLPEKADSVKAIPIPAMHFTSLRPKMVEKDGKMVFEETEGMYRQELKNLNSAYYNCSQCHVPQTNVTVNIENLFTPEFRQKLNANKSNLKDKINEGISN